MSRSFRATAALLCAAAVAALTGPAVAADQAVAYGPPLDAPVVDPFRAPVDPYAAGNRGIDYQADPGQPVLASADGEVVFAGRIGGSVHVVVLHADGIRTSYSFLASASVRRGQRVSRADAIGVAAGQVHFGARLGDVYLDPADLLAGDLPELRLVPVEPLPEEREKGGLLRYLRRIAGRAIGGIRAGAGFVAGATGRLLDSELWATIVHYAGAVLPPAIAWRVVGAIERGLSRAAAPCTPEGQEPNPPQQRRILVRVSGLGSSSGSILGGGGIGGIDPAKLGFDAADTYTFSYASEDGACVEDGAAYTKQDTLNSLDVSGARLARTLDRIRDENPGVPIVVVAHSQGGLVARSALRQGSLEGVSDVITLATPHHGSDLGTGGQLLGRVPTGDLALEAAGALAGLDPDSPAIRQLSETSDFIRGLPPPPAGVRLTSIAAAGDLAVPVPRAHVEGADNRVIDSDSAVGDHFGITSDSDAAREIRLALAGLPAVCRSIASHVLNEVRGELTGTGVDITSLLLTGLALRPALPGRP